MSSLIAPTGRRLSILALALVFLPLLIEALLLNPRELAHYPQPIAVALRLVLLNALPYLAAAMAVAVLTWALRTKAYAASLPPPRYSLPLCGIAMALAVLAAFGARSPMSTLMVDNVSVYPGGVQLGYGGPLAAFFPLAPIAVEEAGSLSQYMLPAQPAPWNATVRWVGVRTAAHSSKDTRIELVAGGVVHDVTADFASLRLGEAAIFSKQVRVGPGATTVRLRLDRASLPPAAFLSAAYAQEAQGIAVDSGGGDRAYRMTAKAGPGASSAPFFSIEGVHVSTGYSVVVISGKAWQHHDLAPFLSKDGVLQLKLAASALPDWEVRLVGDGTQSEAVPLARFTRSMLGDLAQYELPLKQVVWGATPPSGVVGLAMAYKGPPGPFTLHLASAQVLLPEIPKTGFALATTGALDPSARPAEAWFVAGTTPATYSFRSHLLAIRLGAAFFAILGVLGVRTAWRTVRTWPLLTALAVFAALLSAVLIPPVLGVIAAPQLEQLPLSMAALTLSALAWAWASRLPKTREQSASTPLVHNQNNNLHWLDALNGIGILGVIAIHVTADPAGLPFVGFSPDQRVAPAVLRALVSGLNYPIFIIASFFLLAHTLDMKTKSYAEVLRARARRLLPPFLIWSVAFLVLRFAKAYAFGYEEGYRREIASPDSWLGYLLLGNAQYHLHLLPLLFCMTLVYPLFLAARRNPRLALLLPVTLVVWPFIDTFVYQHIAAPEWRQYVLRVTKILAYVGYGWMGFALYELQRSGIKQAQQRTLLVVALLVAGASLAVLLRDAYQVAAVGHWLERNLVSHMALYLAPAAFFMLFMLATHIRWPVVFARLGFYSFGIYLIHPAVLEGLEILQRGRIITPAQTVAFNLVAVTLLTLALVAVINTRPALRWVLGLNRQGRA